MTSTPLSPTKVVSREEWLTARKAHLERERALTHELDALREERRRGGKGKFKRHWSCPPPDTEQP